MAKLKHASLIDKLPLTDQQRRILLAPDSFKGSFSAVEFCRIASSVIEAMLPAAKITSTPLSDGGEGFLECYQAALKSHKSPLKLIGVPSCDPHRRPIQSHLLVDKHRQFAVIESATAIGLPLLKPTERDPLQTSSHGLGWLIKAALDRNCRHLVIGLGGSATNDGGAGMLEVLGAQFIRHDKTKSEPICGGNLEQFLGIDRTLLDSRLTTCHITAACDVDAPLFGPGGASLTYAPQKGANQTSARSLDLQLKHFWNLTGKLASDHGGAAGGLAYGLKWLGASLESGAEHILKLWNLRDTLLAGIDLIITGEGRLDQQTSQGKVLARLAALAECYQIPCMALCGDIESPAPQIPGLQAAFRLEPDGTNGFATEQSLRSAVADGLKRYFIS